MMGTCEFLARDMVVRSDRPDEERDQSLVDL